MIVMAQSVSRQYVVDELNRLGYKELASEAPRDLPDPVDIDRLETWCMRHGLTRDEVINRDQLTSL